MFINPISFNFTRYQNNSNNKALKTKQNQINPLNLNIFKTQKQTQNLAFSGLSKIKIRIRKPNAKKDNEQIFYQAQRISQNAKAIYSDVLNSIEKINARAKTIQSSSNDIIKRGEEVKNAAIEQKTKNLEYIMKAKANKFQDEFDPKTQITRKYELSETKDSFILIKMRQFKNDELINETNAVAYFDLNQAIEDKLFYVESMMNCKNYNNDNNAQKNSSKVDIYEFAFDNLKNCSLGVEYLEDGEFKIDEVLRWDEIKSDNPLKLYKNNLYKDKNNSIKNEKMYVFDSDNNLKTYVKNCSNLADGTSLGFDERINYRDNNIIRYEKENKFSPDDSTNFFAQYYDKEKGIYRTNYSINPQKNIEHAQSEFNFKVKDNFFIDREIYSYKTNYSKINDTVQSDEQYQFVNKLLSSYILHHKENPTMGEVYDEQYNWDHISGSLKSYIKGFIKTKNASARADVTKFFKPI